MKTTMKPDRTDALQREYRNRKARAARSRRNLNWLAKEFKGTLIGEMSTALSRELKRMY